MKTREKLEILQATRGIAALGIVYFHTEYGPYESANWGVDFFFILSGFLIMLSTQNSGEIKRFWFSRIIKICPLYWFMSVAVIILYQIIPSVFHAKTVTVEMVIKSSLFIPCYATDGKIMPVYGVGWTLTLEMFFYLIFSICMKINHKKRGILAICVLAVLVVSGCLYSGQNAMIIFWTDKRLVDFIMGIVIYYTYKAGIYPVRKKISIVLMSVEIVMLFAGKYIMKDAFSILWNIFFGSCLLMSSLLYGREKCNKFLVMIGNISYSMYMVHVLPIRFVIRILIDTNIYSIKNTILVILAILVVVPVSYVAYRIWEVYIPQKIKGIFETQHKKLERKAE